MIETEGGRGEANVGREPVGQYLVRPIRGNFSPEEYGRRSPTRKPPASTR
jgi:hypothetical protein